MNSEKAKALRGIGIAAIVAVVIIIISSGCTMSFGGDRIELGDGVAVVGGTYSDSLGICLDLDINGEIVVYCPDIDLK